VCLCVCVCVCVCERVNVCMLCKHVRVYRWIGWMHVCMKVSTCHVLLSAFAPFPNALLTRCIPHTQFYRMLDMVKVYRDMNMTGWACFAAMDICTLFGNDTVVAFHMYVPLMHAYIHTSIHTHTCIYPYILTYTQTYKHTHALI